jgi:hypothetical protein
MTHQKIQTNNQANTTEGKVGYKRPPVKSQFRKGQCGNPRGRRKGQRNLRTVLDEVLCQTVAVKQEGKARRMSKGEALIQMLLNKAHQGDSRATKAVLELSEKIGRIETAELKLGGRGNYEFMLVPGIAASSEEWQREIANRDEAAALREPSMNSPNAFVGRNRSSPNTKAAKGVSTSWNLSSFVRPSKQTPINC